MPHAKSTIRGLSAGRQRGKFMKKIIKFYDPLRRFIFSAGCIASSATMKNIASNSNLLSSNNVKSYTFLYHIFPLIFSLLKWKHKTRLLKFN